MRVSENCVYDEGHIWIMTHTLILPKGRMLRPVLLCLNRPKRPNDVSHMKCLL